MTSLANDAVLPVVNGRVSIAPSLVSGPFETALGLATNNLPVELANAQRTATATQVVITGTANFLSQEGTAVTATVTTDAQSGEVTAAMLGIQVVGGSAGATGWNLGTSFGSLPAFLTSLTADGTGSGLTTLSFTEAAFFVTSNNGFTDPATQAALPVGMGFAGSTSIASLFGGLASWIAGAASWVLSGPVLLPPTAGNPSPPQEPGLPTVQYPWSMASPPPGIYLTSPISLSFTIPGTNLSLSQGTLQLYTPVSTAWIQANPGIFPALAIEATLAIPSAGLSVNIAIDDPIGNSNLTVEGFFTGFSLSKLEQLADLVGSSNLTSILPSDVTVALSELSLLNLAIFLGSDFSVAGVAIALGMPNISTTVVPSFTIGSLVANFGIESPFASPALSLELTGQFVLYGTVTAVSILLPQGLATASLPDGVTVDFSSAAPSLGLPSGIPDLVIDELEIEFDLQGDLSFFASMAQNPPWTLTLGPTTVTASDISASVLRQSGVWSGGFSGTFQVGSDLTLSTDLVLPGSFQLTASLPTTTLSELIVALTDASVSLLPAGFDLTFTDSSVLIQDGGGTLELLLTTTLSGFGTVIFLVQEVAGSWCFAAGVNISSTASIGSLPGLDLLSSFSGFTLSDLVLVVSSLTAPNFALPALSIFSQAGLPVPAQGVTLPAQAQVLVEGVNFYGQWTIDPSDQQQGLLSSLLQLNPTLDITLQVSVPPEKDTRFFISLTTTGNGDTLAIVGQPLVCDVGVQIQNSQPSLFLDGQLTCTIQGTTQTIDVVLEWTTNGAFIMGSMTGDQTISFGSVQLADLLVMVGLDWEGVPSLGFGATLEDEGLDASLTIILNSANPAQSVLAGAISPCSLRQVFDVLTDDLAPSVIDDVLAQVQLVAPGNPATLAADLQADLNGYNLAPVAAALKAAGFQVTTNTADLLLILNKDPASQPAAQVTSWGLTDVSTGLHYQLESQGSAITVTLDPQFQLVPETLTLGGMTYNQGMFVDAGLDVEGFAFGVTVEIQPSNGILVDGSISKPIVFFSPDLFALTNSDGTAGPALSASTFTTTDPDTQQKVGPHFQLSGQVALLGSDTAIQVDITTSGFSFTIQDDFLGLVTADLSGSYSSSAGLAVSGSLSVGVTSLDLGPLGTIDLDTGVAAQLAIAAGQDTASASLAGSLTLFGHTFDLPTVSLSIGTSTMSDIPALITSAVVQGLENYYKNDVQAWVNDAESALISGIDDIANVLSTVFNQTEQEVQQLLADAQGCAVTAAASVF